MFRKAYLLYSLSVFLLFISCELNNKKLPYYNSADFTPIFLTSKVSVEKSITHFIDNFSFINQNGDTITHQEIENKIHIANFIFTSCSNICPTMTSNMKLVEKAFFDNKNIKILSYSVTPWIDTPEKLNKYANLNGIKSSNWHFLTGDRAKIYSLARRSYFAEQSIGFTKDSADFLHTEHFILIDKDRRIRGIYNGTLSLEMKQLIKDVNALYRDEF